MRSTRRTKEKQKKERAESQTIKANSTLARKREKAYIRYTRPLDKGHQFSPGFLENAPEEAFIFVGGADSCSPYIMETLLPEIVFKYCDCRFVKKKFEQLYY